MIGALVVGCAFLLAAAAVELPFGDVGPAALNPLPLVLAALASFAVSAQRYHRGQEVAPGDNQALFGKGERQLRMVFDHERAAGIARRLALIFLFFAVATQAGVMVLEAGPPEASPPAMPAVSAPQSKPAPGPAGKRGRVKKNVKAPRP